MSSERQLNTTKSPWWGEHLHRYQEASKLLKKKSKVLDIACGSGFGSFFVAQQEHTVIGGDISEITITDCAQKHKHSNLSFKVLDGTNLPFEDATFDAIISLETIEHTVHYQLILNEFKRIVKKDGFIIISTPNFLINSPKGIIINKFHTQEWMYEDLSKLLNTTYSSVTITGQAYSRYSNKKKLNYIIGFYIETLLYKRGIRKLPITIQDIIMKIIIGEPMYPEAINYTFVNSIVDIKQCKTFFAICKP